MHINDIFPEHKRLINYGGNETSLPNKPEEKDIPSQIVPKCTEEGETKWSTPPGGNKLGNEKDDEGT